MTSFSRSALLTGLAAVVAGAALPRIAGAQSTTVRIAGVFSDLFAEPFYAKDAGAFAKAGFDVQTTSLNNAGAVAAAIGGGSLELGTGDLISGVNAINAGVPVVLVAGGGLYNERGDQGSTILAVTNDSPIKTAKDLVGKSIGVPTLAGLSTACLRAWLPAHGVPLDSVKLVEIPQSASPAALQRGTLDAGLLSEPFVTFAKSSTRAIGSPFDAAADAFPSGTPTRRGSKPTPRARGASSRRSTTPLGGPTRIATTRSTFSCATDNSIRCKRAVCSGRPTPRR
jgi:NitT/TauT family transport system substrate-binding protein